jgi:hypothetical protein
MQCEPLLSLSRVAPGRGLVTENVHGFAGIWTLFQSSFSEDLMVDWGGCGILIRVPAPDLDPSPVDRRQLPSEL